MDRRQLCGGERTHAGEGRLTEPHHAALAHDEREGEEEHAQRNTTRDEADPEAGQDHR